MKVNAKKLYLKLGKAQNKYESEFGEVEKLISDKVEFEFHIFYQPSDGVVMLHVDENHNAPIYPLLNIIEGKGVLTYEDYLQETI